MSYTVVCSDPAKSGNTDEKEQFELFKRKLSLYNSWSTTRLIEIERCWKLQDRFFIPRTKTELLTFAQKFASYESQVSSMDGPVSRLWNQQCDMQNPLFDLVLQKLRNKYFIKEDYVQSIFADIDHQFSSLQKTLPCSSLPVYAFVLFARFNNTWPEIWHRFTKRRLRSMKTWFDLITEMSPKAKAFTQEIGVQNVIFAMCVFQAFKMLHGIDGLKYKASLMGRLMFHDHNRERARQNFCLLEIAFLKQLNWDVHVNATVYKAQVAILTWPDFDTVNTDMTEFDRVTKQGLAILKMLDEAAEVPDTPLSEHPCTFGLGALGRLFLQNWDIQEKNSLERVSASCNGRAVPHCTIGWDVSTAWAVVQSPW